MNRPRLLFLLLIFMISRATAQEQQLEHTLLWRISGNGLQSPSYLFGTIHLKNKRVFNFPDSLYSAIEGCQVFALEFNADSLNSLVNDYLGNSIEKGSYKRQTKKLKDQLSKKELDQLQKKIGKNEKIDVGEITAKQAYLLKEKLLAPKEKPDDMVTFMDAFLYRIARDEDKEIAGVESAETEKMLLNDIGDDAVDAKGLLDKIQTQNNNSDLLVDIYLEKDLAKLQAWMQLLPSELEQKILSDRNKKMLVNMDSIMRHKSLFTAVGAAHLPGAYGLISLLRKTGYTVEPVLCPTNTPAAQYKFKREDQPWVDVIDTVAGYSIKLPSQPSEMLVMGGLLKMKTCIDITTNSGYYVIHVVAPTLSDPQFRDSVINGAAKKMMDNMECINVKKHDVVNNGAAGKEYTFDGKKDHYTMQLLVSGNDLYMLMSNSTNEKNNGTDSFYQSFRLLLKHTSKWADVTFAEDHIRIKMPGDKPKPATTFDADSSVKQALYTLVDGNNGSYYFLAISKTSKGFNYINDSAIIKSLETKLSEKELYLERTDIDDTTHTTYDYHAVQGAGLVIKGKMVFRGNWFINAFSIYKDETTAASDVADYLSSLTLLPLPVPQLGRYTAPDSSFSMYVPGPFKPIVSKKKTDDTGSDEVKDDGYHHFRSYDDKRLICYDVFEKNLSKYYWNNNDTATLHQWLTISKEDHEELSNIKYSFGKRSMSAEALTINPRTSQRERIKVVGRGRTRYLIKTMIPPFALQDKSIDSTYDLFTILKKDTAGLRPDPSAFFAALHSSDTTIYNDAVASSDQVYFSKRDLPYVVKEFAKTFALDSSNDLSASNILLEQLQLYPDQLSVKELADMYLDLPANRSAQKFALLKLFTYINDSVAAYEQLKQLLLSHPPEDGNSYDLLVRLKSCHGMPQKLFPELLQLTSDSVNCSLVCLLAKDLLDSSYLSVNSIKGQLPLLLANSKRYRVAYNTSHSYYGTYHGFVELLSVFDSQDALDEITQYQYVKVPNIRYDAIRLLLAKNIQPDVKSVDSLATDMGFRQDIYELLKENKKAELFPKHYLSQRYFAESHLFLSTDDGYDQVDLIGEKMTMYKNKMQKFYVFEVKYHADDSDSYLGIAGPYSGRSSELYPIKNNDATGVYLSEPLNKTDVDRQQRAYLKKLEETVANE